MPQKREKPSGREHIDAFARNLLSDLTKLSETSCDTEIPKPAAKAHPRKEKQISGNDDAEFKNVEMKRGDWMCPKCSFMNFSRNTRCLKCKAEGPKRVAMDNVQMKKGDWNCPGRHIMTGSYLYECLWEALQQRIRMILINMQLTPYVF
ncbi:hypothetical protein J1N35_038315 [Gossypium stocksii]|uniref:RanBP2-type domain-containing protein n=1 Tax=Gossypium stocksii TaxID=47602 RepID=A0A9D3ULU1_9ROSI|nr:hypothetical protein J1N35_038315 [Gossypium stocksii]